MSNPNFVNDLVMMAKAYEELPKVQEALEIERKMSDERLGRIQALELKLLDRAAELDAAHAATRKAEVERDHAETMFLETDSKLDAIKSFLSGQIGAASALFAAMEPPQPEPVVEHHDDFGAKLDEPMPEVKVGASEVDLPDVEEHKFDDGGPYNEPKAIDNPLYADPQKQDEAQGQSEGLPTEQTSAPVDTVQSTVSHTDQDVSTVAEASEVAPPVDPIAPFTAGDGASLDTAVATLSAEPQADASTSEQPTATSSDGVSVPSDPTPATESSSESASPASASLPQPNPEPTPRYSQEWYDWADAVGYWDKPRSAQ